MIDWTLVIVSALAAIPATIGALAAFSAKRQATAAAKTGQIAATEAVAAKDASQEAVTEAVAAKAASKAAEMRAAKVATMVELLSHNVDGRLTQLLEETRKSEHAAGVEQERTEEQSRQRAKEERTQNDTTQPKGGE